MGVRKNQVLSENQVKEIRGEGGRMKPGSDTKDRQRWHSEKYDHHKHVRSRRHQCPHR